MADDNLGQFGMRDDTIDQAVKGGQMSGGSKKSDIKARGAAGKTKAAKRGGEHSHGGRRSSR